MTKDELRERLAAIEHDRWSDWQKWVHHGARIVGPVCSRIGDGFGYHAREISAENVGRWERQIATPYDDLSESEKDSDRKQVDRYWPLIEQYIDDEVERRLAAHGAAA